MTRTTSPSSAGWRRPRGAERACRTRRRERRARRRRGRASQRAAAERAVSGRRAPGIADHRGREAEQPGEGDLGRGRAVRVGDVRERLATGETARAARPSERRVGDHRDPSLGTALDDASPQRRVVEGAERNLDGRDRSELERFVQLPAIDVREPDPAHQAFVGEPRESAHRRSPRRSGIGRMDEIQVDRDAVQGGETRFAVGEDRLGAAIRDPGAAGASHASLGHDPRRRLRAAPAESACDQLLVVAVRARGVEHRHARLGGGRDRRERALLVTVLVRRQAHAAETDPELRGIKPCRATQATNDSPSRGLTPTVPPQRRRGSRGRRRG